MAAGTATLNAPASRALGASDTRHVCDASATFTSTTDRAGGHHVHAAGRADRGVGVVERVHRLLQYSSQFVPQAHDPEVTQELYLKISGGFADSPELRVAWIENLITLHISVSCSLLFSVDVAVFVIYGDCVIAGLVLVLFCSFFVVLDVLRSGLSSLGGFEDSIAPVD